MAVLVVGGAFLRIRQDFVGLFAFLELGFGGGLGVVALMAVRVVFGRELAVSLLDFIFAGVAGQAQDFVVVAFGRLEQDLDFIGRGKGKRRRESGGSLGIGSRFLPADAKNAALKRSAALQTHAGHEARLRFSAHPDSRFRLLTARL